MASVEPRLVLLNMPRAKGELGGATNWVAGDGRCLPFRDGAFDVVFSNSVIEHVGDAASQERFAREVARVGRGFWVQTPNRWFPVEQHLMTPLVHWLPKRWQRAIVRRGTRMGRADSASRRTAANSMWSISCVTSGCWDAASLRVLFPGAR